MRTRAQIGKLLYDNLSNSAWSRLRKATLSRELIAIGTDIIYKYEILAHASPWDPDTPGVQPPTRSDFRTTVSNYLLTNPGGWSNNDVTSAVIDWATEVLYQAYLAVKKNKEDEVVDTASYVGLIEDSLKLTNPVPVSQCRPATLTVMLPIGNEVYPPYSVSISCGAAQFWNIKTYRSGEQATLYQGVPYYYGTDISGLTEASVFDSTITNVDEDRYVKLTTTTYPESVQVYSVSNTYYCFNPRPVLQKFPAFKVQTSQDGSIETHFSDGTWGTGDVNFRPDAEDWCIRFLDLTDTEFDITTVTLPDGYTLLASEQANFTDLDYAQRYFCKWQYMFDGVVGEDYVNLLKFITSIPNIQEVSVAAGNGVIYVKPVKGSENLIFDEVEGFLNDYYVIPSGSTITKLQVFCGYPRDFTVQIKINNTSKFSTELRSRIADFIKERYSYENVSFFSSLIASNIKEIIKSKFALDDGDFDVKLVISQGVYRSSVKFSRAFDYDTAQMSRDDTVTAYSDRGAIQQLSLVPLGRMMDIPSASLSSCWGWNPESTPTPGLSASYNVKSREYVSGGSPLSANSTDDLLWDGCGLKAAYNVNAGVGILYVMSTYQDYFLNPFPQVGWGALNPFMQVDDLSKIDQIKVGLNGTPFYVPGTGVNYFYSVVLDSVSGGYRINKYDSNGLAVTGPTIFPLPSKPTYASYYDGDVYISCESAQIAIVKRLADYIQGGDAWDINYDFFVYGIYDSTSTAIPAVDLLPWSFNQQGIGRYSSIYKPDFYACVGLDGGMSILTLDAEDPGIDVPAGVSASGERAVALFNSYSKSKRKQINSKWHFYTVDRFKITAKGLQTINMREIATMPTFASCNEGVESSNEWIALRYGFWTFSGRAIHNGLGVTSAYQTYMGWSETSHISSLLNTAYYDLINNISSYSESASYDSSPSERGLILSYTSSTVGSATPAAQPTTVTLNGGSYAHNIISVVADAVESDQDLTPDCYIELSDEIVKWI